MFYSNTRFIKANHPNAYDKEVRDALCRNCGCVIGEQLRYPHLKSEVFNFASEKDSYEYCPHCGHKFVKTNKEFWCITTEDDWGLLYLGWQNPVWNEDGYFWTSKNVIREILQHNIPEHPFLFKTEQEAIKHAKSIGLPQKWKAIKF